jgi:hypothetical protein
MTASTCNFPLGNEFPREGFVQHAVKCHFDALGFVSEVSGQVDYCCAQPTTHERWHIEAKGATSQIGLDFRTGLGQLIQGMSNEATKYAIAFPASDAFLKQARRIAPWVRMKLNLHWLIVHPDGAVRIVLPTQMDF